jgi:NADH:ubiquinone oxidoreductase subunit C
VNMERCLEQLREACPSQELRVYAQPMDETVVELPSACLQQAVAALVEQGTIYHLSTITGQDTGDAIELLYHFWDGSGLTLRTALPREQTTIATLTGVIPGAAFYEREVAEMLHVTFEGHPGPKGLLLPDDWGGESPLRREFSLSPDEGDPT